MDFMTAPGAMLTKAERQFLYMAANTTSLVCGATCKIVNIGVAEGGSLWCLRAGAPRAELIGIDIDPDSARGEWIFHLADSRRVHANIQPPIHLLFIDGDHDYYGVKADIINWIPKVPVGGVVMFHDYGNAEKFQWTAGVKRAVDELMLNDEWIDAGGADSIRAFRRNVKREG